MIIKLIRDGDACRAEAPGVPAHRVAAFPFADAEAEVRRRVLRSLADRVRPPSSIAFVRTWELSTAPEADAPTHIVNGPGVFVHDGEGGIVEAPVGLPVSVGDAPAPKPRRQRGGAKQ